MLSLAPSNYFYAFVALVVAVLLPFNAFGQCTPSPIAYNGLVVGLPTSGTVSLPAAVLDAGSIDECNSGGLSFSFSSDVNDQNLGFSCSEAGSSQLVELWVTDQNGGQNFVETYVLIQDSDGNCPSGTNDCGPVAIVYNGLVIDLSAGIVSLPATAFNAGSLDACNTGGLTFEVASSGSPVFSPSITLDCNDDASKLVQVRVTDALGNQNTVETFIILNDNLGVCTGSSPIDECGPVPILMNGLAVGLPDDGQLELPLSSAFLGSIDGCDAGSLESTLSRLGELPDYNANTMSIDCDDAGSALLAEGYMRDALGNETYATTYILVQDNLAPTLSEAGCAIENLNVDLDPDGTKIFGTQVFLFLSPSDNCGNPQLSFSSDPNDISFFFDCSDIQTFGVQQSSGIVEVPVWATDSAGNQTNCEVTIQVNDKHSICTSSTCTGDQYNLSGTITPDYYRASDYIYASGEIEAPTRFQAANSIILSPGFRVSTDSYNYFKASIAPCTTTEASLLPPFPQETPIQELNVKVFPNPLNSGSRIQVNLPVYGPLQVTLWDQTGRQVHQFIDTPRYDDLHWTSEISVGDLPSGMYFLRVVSGEQQLVKKLIRTR